MFAEGSIVSNGDKYQLPPTKYTESVERANKKKQAIIDANNRLLKIRDKFTEPYYKIEDAQRKYVLILENMSIENFETDMKTLGYTISSDYLIFKFTSIAEYLRSELLKLDIIEINHFSQKYNALIECIDLNHLLEKMKINYQIIEFEKGSSINFE